MGVRSCIVVMDFENDGVKNGPKFVVSKIRSAPNFLRSDGILINFLIDEAPMNLFLCRTIV